MYTLFSFLKNSETEVDCIKQIQKKNSDLVNESIPHGNLLVIDENGGKVGIISRREALAMATVKELDLVVVSPDSKPMVAKFMDYSKYRYEQQRKLREAKKHQKTVSLKEIRLSPKIDIGDFNTKLTHGRKFLENGDKLKISIRFRGREMAYTSRGRQVMMDYAKELEDIAQIESRPVQDGRNMFMTLTPKKDK